MRPCSAPAPMLENPRRLRTMVRETKAQFGGRVAPEDAETLCRRTTPYTKGWKASADRRCSACKGCCGTEQATERWDSIRPLEYRRRQFGGRSDKTRPPFSEGRPCLQMPEYRRCTLRGLLTYSVSMELYAAAGLRISEFWLWAKERLRVY